MNSAPPELLNAIHKARALRALDGQDWLVVRIGGPKSLVFRPVASAIGLQYPDEAIVYYGERDAQWRNVED
jgi:hypothetical protein